MAAMPPPIAGDEFDPDLAKIATAIQGLAQSNPERAKTKLAELTAIQRRRNDQRVLTQAREGGDVQPALESVQHRFPGLKTPPEHERVKPTPLLKSTLASLPLTTAGQIAELERQFGRGMVRQLETGEIVAQTPEGIRRLGGAGSLVGPGIEVVPEVVAGVGTAVSGVGLPATATAAAGGAALGSALRQSAAEAFTGGDDLTMGERFVSAAIPAVAAGAGEVVAPFVGPAVRRAIRPQRTATEALMRKAIPERVVTGELATERAAEASAQLADMGAEGLGTVAGLTGAKEALDAETVLRRMPGAAPVFAEKDLTRIKVLTRETDRRVQALAAQKVSPGDAVRTANVVAEQAFESMHSARSDSWKAGAKVLKDMVGEDPRVSTNGLVGAVERIIDEHEASAEAAQGLGRTLTILKKRADEGGAVNLDKLMRLRSQWSAETVGKGSILPNIGATERNVVARKMISAIDAAVDGTIYGGGLGDDAVRHLQQMRQTYAEQSQRIEGYRIGLVNKLLKTEGGEVLNADELPKHLATRADPQQIRKLFGLLGKDPSAGQLRVATMQAILDESALATGSQLRKMEGLGPTSGRMLSPAKVQNQLGKPNVQRRMKAVLEGDSRASNLWSKIGRVAQIIDPTGSLGGTSPTASIQMQAGQLATNLDGVKSAAVEKSKDLAKFIRMGGPRKMALIFNNPESINLALKLHTLDRASHSSRAAARQLAVTGAQLAAIVVRDDQLYDNPEQEQ